MTNSKVKPENTTSTAPVIITSLEAQEKVDSCELLLTKAKWELRNALSRDKSLEQLALKNKQLEIQLVNQQEEINRLSSLKVVKDRDKIKHWINMLHGHLIRSEFMDDEHLDDLYKDLQAL